MRIIKIPRRRKEEKYEVKNDNKSSKNEKDDEKERQKKRVDRDGMLKIVKMEELSEFVDLH